MSPVSKSQTTLLDSPTGRIVGMDSAYDVDSSNRSRDVVVTGSYSGVLCARFVAAHSPRGIIGVDCGIGLDGSAIAGLWFYEALDLPAATVDVATVELGNGCDVYESGVVSRLNEPAIALGLREGMSVKEAAARMLESAPVHQRSPSEITHRTIVLEQGQHAVICTDSIAFALPEDRDRNVLCTGGHTGRSAVPYLEAAHPLGFICSDGGVGKNESGIQGLKMVEDRGLAGAAVDVRTARMGDGMSTYHDGVISALNSPAAECGVRKGMTAREAAEKLIAARGSKPS